MNRREILRTGLAVVSTAGISTRLLATDSSGPRFLLVFLRGGYDCANLLIPYSSSFYYEARPQIAIARPDTATSTNATSGSNPQISASPASALALDSDWALAPAVRESIGSMYSQGQVSFVPFAGTDDLSRSHFHTQDTIELGAAGASLRDYSSGFLARLSAVLTDGAPISFTDGLPLAFKGRTGVPNLQLRGLGQPILDERQASLLGEMYAGNPLGLVIADGLQLRQEVARSMEKDTREASRDAIDPPDLAVVAARMAPLMRDRYRLGFIDIGGWDTHVNEGGAQGTLATHLHNLGGGLQAFAKAMGPDWKNTVIVVLSEFGRTFRENGNRGTDHGHGSVYWVMGGSISGGRVAGEQQRVEHDTLFQDRDFPVLNDHRAVLGGLFRRMWDLSPAQLGRVFPDVAPADLKLA
jgi:uncharacterized protein (DUF1501 family)